MGRTRGPPQGALHVLALVNNRARISHLTNGNSVTPAQVTSIKVKEKSIDLTVLAGDRSSILVAGALQGQQNRLSYRERSDVSAFQRETSAVGT
jgi:hypothetical protein